MLKKEALDPNDHNPELDRVVCTFAQIFNVELRTDYHLLAQDSLVDDTYDFEQLLNLAETVLVHKCTSAKSRCQKINSEGKKVCRVLRHRPVD